MDIAPIIVLFRRDLRLHDHVALMEASCAPIIPLYIQDDSFELGGASRSWLHHSLLDLQKNGFPLIIRKGKTQKVINDLVKETNAKSVYASKCYEPDYLHLDAILKAELKVPYRTFEGALLFDPSKIFNKQNKPFQVFTPFWNACTQAIPRKPFGLADIQIYPKKIPTLSVLDLKLLPSIPWDASFYNQSKPGEKGAQVALNQFIKNGLSNYLDTRDRPDFEEGVSHLSAHLHFGEISPFQIFHACLENPKAGAFLRQLGWREFAHYLLYHFPHTVDQPLRTSFLNFPWRKDEKQLQAWQKGLTGYPIVDAGMRQLWQTGWMHNRVRMIVGSFLVKDLLQSWQEGAKWFMDTLVDADLANNTLGWQWVGGTGADAAPYFRIFNPETQGEKFDPEGEYVKRYVPELKNMPTKWIHKPHLAPPLILMSAHVTLGKDYPYPIVDHSKARERALAAFNCLKFS